MLRRRVATSLVGSAVGAIATSSSFTSQYSLRHATDAKTVRTPHKFEQFICAENDSYVSELTQLYLTDKYRVDSSWWPVLANLVSANPDEALLDAIQRPIDPTKSGLSEKERIDNMKLAWMVRAFEYRGHHLCRLDPLGMYEADLRPLTDAGLAPEDFGFTEADMDRVFRINIGASFGAMVTSGTTPMKLRDIIEKLREVYTGPIGFEFMHAGFYDLRNWFREEIMSTISPSPAQYRERAFKEVAKACGFEKFLQTKYQTQKRFGLDGAEALIPAMNACIDVLGQRGAEDIIIGMPHRGRLNVLVNVCGKSLEKVFNEFEGRTPKAEVKGTGDVKYHLGIQKIIETYTGKKININLLANPSHLECINPLVVGKARAQQWKRKDKTHTQVVPILMHGDAAFSGQGVSYETLGLADLDSFTVGGTIHFVVNNQVGFTTDPKQSRSALYCTDLGKVNNSPVIHVNADNVDQCVRAARIAAKFRQAFRRDVIIDLVCYRRNGHNESDVPMFTQPVMYKKIATHPVVVDIYAKELEKDKVMTKEAIKAIKDEYNGIVKVAHETALNDSGYVKVKNAEIDRESTDPKLKGAETTGLAFELLKRVGMAVTEVPTEFKIHPKAEGPMRLRREAVTNGKDVEWCLAEQIAMGSLALEGYHVRLTGQDVERGTFSQRHAVLVDSATNTKYMPLSRVAPDQALVTISNSSLSEFGVCGFETGFAVDNINSLCMWEAQFGDFANGAQVIFDQFLSSGEAKWFLQNVLTISLPHGYDGQGPEHSSSRLERFLQLSQDSHNLPADFDPRVTNQDLIDLSENRIRDTNWQVCYPSRPANYFHLLRRQVHRSFRKPLVFAFAKSGVRAPNLSTFAEMGPGTSFQHTIISQLTPSAPPESIRKVVLCTGQIERKFRLAVEAKRKETGNDSLHNDIAFVLLEQIAPFPWEHVAQAIKPYFDANPNVELAWLQEEPKNMGCWAYVRPRLNNLVQHMKKDKSFRTPYIGRPTSASPSTGFEYVHADEESEIFKATMA